MGVVEEECWIAERDVVRVKQKDLSEPAVDNGEALELPPGCRVPARWTINLARVYESHVEAREDTANIDGQVEIVKMPDLNGQAASMNLAQDPDCDPGTCDDIPTYGHHDAATVGPGGWLRCKRVDVVNQQSLLCFKRAVKLVDG